MLLHTIGVTPAAAAAAAGAGAVSHTGSASDARTPIDALRPSHPEATPATAGPSGGFCHLLHTQPIACMQIFLPLLVGGWVQLKVS